MPWLQQVSYLLFSFRYFAVTCPAIDGEVGGNVHYGDCSYSLHKTDLQIFFEVLIINISSILNEDVQCREKSNNSRENSHEQSHDNHFLFNSGWKRTISCGSAQKINIYINIWRWSQADSYRNFIKRAAAQ